MGAMIEIIGISGKSGSGKDFLGREVLRPLGYQRYSLAWPMKNEACGTPLVDYMAPPIRGEGSSVYSYPGARARCPTYEEVHHIKPPHIRKWLQERGTERGWKLYGRDYWTKIADAWIRTLHEEHGVDRFYVPDIRFMHEVEWIRRLGGKLVRLEHGDRPYPLAGTAAADHESETALDGFEDWDCRIENGLGMHSTTLWSLLWAGGIVPDPWHTPRG